MNSILENNRLPNGAKRNGHTILFATDGTTAAYPALENAIRMLRHSNGRLLITYFANPEDSALYHGAPCRSEFEWQAYGRNILKRLQDKARREGIENVETILETYQGEERLPELAQKYGADMIIIGSHLFNI